MSSPNTQAAFSRRKNKRRFAKKNNNKFQSFNEQTLSWGAPPIALKPALNLQTTEAEGKADSKGKEERKEVTLLLDLRIKILRL